MPEKISETQVAQIWQRQSLNKTMLTTEDGHPLEVVYPGRPNDDRGADFRDAVISANRSLLKGDIEVHVRSSDWHSHGHDSDAAYNGVILHVVMWHNCHRATALQDGREVPVLALEKYCLDSFPPPVSRGPPCVGCPPEIIEGFLDEAGETRFLAKAYGFRDRLSRTGAAQALFEGIMEALGYAKNMQPFLELAERLPLEVLESVTQSRLPNNECLAALQALLLGTAGLRPDWHFSNSMSPQSWNTFKVRPQNSPVRRLIALSYLLVGYRERGILDELIGKLAPAGRDEDRREYDILEKAFMVGTAGRPGRNVALLGRERAAVIVINVLLPFSYAWGHLTRRTGLKQKALDLFRHYPGRTVNSIEKHMGCQLGLNHKAFRSARRQQGLLHIYKSLCTQGKCGDCALGQPHSGQHVHV